MISRFFSKSKPIHSIIIFILLGIVFFYARHQYILENIFSLQILKQIGMLLVAVFSVFVLDFINGKNHLTQKHSYTILIFGLLHALIPQSLSDTSIIVSNLFILFALRRLISLQSKLYIKKKLFDATFWIVIATLFQFWSILFLVLVFVALMYYAQNDIKNWIIPLVTIAAITIIVLAFNILVYDDFLNENIAMPVISFDFSNYNTVSSIAAITLIFTILLWTSVFYIKLMREVTGKLRPAFVLIGFSVIIALAILIISPLKTGGEFIFLFAPSINNNGKIFRNC